MIETMKCIVLGGACFFFGFVVALLLAGANTADPKLPIGKSKP